MEEMLLVKSAIAVNSVAVFIFVIWFISARISERKTKADQEEREKQLETLLKHGQEQFDNAMKLVKDSNDRYYGLQAQSVKHLSMLNETLARLDVKVDYLSKFQIKE